MQQRSGCQRRTATLWRSPEGITARNTDYSDSRPRSGTPKGETGHHPKRTYRRSRSRTHCASIAGFRGEILPPSQDAATPAKATRPLDQRNERTRCRRVAPLEEGRGDRRHAAGRSRRCRHLHHDAQGIRRDIRRRIREPSTDQHSARALSRAVTAVQSPLAARHEARPGIGEAEWTASRPRCFSCQPWRISRGLAPNRRRKAVLKALAEPKPKSRARSEMPRWRYARLRRRA